MDKKSGIVIDFERLGLQEYCDRFLEQGFTDWASICDITESDLAALGVKLGHRRTLYREIARQGGFPSTERLEDFQRFKNNNHRPITPVEDQTTQYASGSGSDGITSPTTCSTSMPQKRRYKRHPKPDDNAPIRPPSAYVIFANMTRENQKDANLSFTQLARLVGERWKHLNPEDKEAIEAQAAEVKRRYVAEVTMYKKSPEYEQYQAYLKEFKDRVARDERPEKLEPPRKAQRVDRREGSPRIADRSPYHRPTETHNYETQVDRSSQPGSRITIPSILHELPRSNNGDQSLPSVGYVYNYAGHDHLRPPNGHAGIHQTPSPILHNSLNNSNRLPGSESAHHQQGPLYR